MALSERDVAFAACDDAFKSALMKATGVFQDCLITAHDDQAKEQCRVRFETAVLTCREAFAANHELVDRLFPAQPAS